MKRRRKLAEKYEDWADPWRRAVVEVVFNRGKLLLPAIQASMAVSGLYPSDIFIHPKTRGIHMMEFYRYRANTGAVSTRQG